MEFYVLMAIICFLLGGALASFAGVVAYRLPKGISIIKPNSFCVACKTPIKWYDNIPILSFIILKGKCRQCSCSIGASGFLIELFSSILFLLAFLQFEFSAFTLILFGLFFLFDIIAYTDFESNDIYNITLIIFAVFAIGICLYKIFIFKQDYLQFIIGCAVGFLFFLLVKVIFKVILKKDALGSGDIFLTGIAGLMLGVMPLLLAIIVATVLGSIIEIVKIKLNKSEREALIAFAPYLLLGFAVLSIFSTTVMDLITKVVMF